MLSLTGSVHSPDNPRLLAGHSQRGAALTGAGIFCSSSGVRDFSRREHFLLHPVGKCQVLFSESQCTFLAAASAGAFNARQKPPFLFVAS